MVVEKRHGGRKQRGLGWTRYNDDLCRDQDEKQMSKLGENECERGFCAVMAPGRGVCLKIPSPGVRVTVAPLFTWAHGCASFNIT